MAKESNSNEFEIDLGTYEFAKSNCGACHPGGGPLEYDRQGNRYDEYLAAGNSPTFLNGDYYHYDATEGEVIQSPWHTSGVLEIDCFMCHLEGYSSSARATEVLAGRFKTSSFAGSGFGTVTDNNTVTYDQTLDDADLNLNINAHDNNCAVCHAMDEKGYATNPGNARSDLKKRGFCWGPIANTPSGYERDVHDAAGIGCTDCHSASIDHKFAKGNDKVGTVRDDLDFTVQSCGDCHTDDDDDDDMVGLDPASAHEDAGFTGIYAGHFDVIDCTTCHIPFKDSPALRTIEIASGVGSSAKYGMWTGGSPGDPSGWTGFQPTYIWWPVEDGTYKIFPMNIMTVILWGQRDPISHDLTYSHYARNLLAAAPNATISDDTGDSKNEVNTAAEILSMRNALAAQEAADGNPDMTDPYLWVMPHLFSISHNVRPSDDALGADGCTDCHAEDTWIFDGDFMIWHYDMEGNSPYVTSHFETINDDGTHDEIEIDFSDADNNTVKNWRMLGYSEARRDELVVER